MLFHVECKSSGTLSSQSKFIFESSDKSSFNPAVRGVNFPSKSKISATFPAQSRRVKFSGIIPSRLASFFPRLFFEKFIYPILRLMKSPLGNHFIPATLIDLSSLANCSGGSHPEIVTGLISKPPFIKTAFNTSVVL